MPDPIQPTGPSVKIGQTRATLPNHPANTLVNPTTDATTGAMWTQGVDANGNITFTLVNPGEVSIVGGVTISGDVVATIDDGGDAAEGSVADAAVQGDNSGTLSAKLRGLNKSIATGISVTIADGSDATEGAKANSVATDSTSSWSVVSLLKGILAGVLDIWNKTTHAWAVTFTNTSIGTTFTNTTIAVTQATAASLNATVTGTVTTTPPSHASTNVDQINGQTPALNAGTSSAGTSRVVQASAAVLNVTQASVLVSSTTVIAANANRIKVRVINTSTNPLWIGPTTPATIGNGAYIPGIAGYPWSTRYEGALYAIATGGTALITVDEESAS